MNIHSPHHGVILYFTVILLSVVFGKQCRRSSKENYWNSSGTKMANSTLVPTLDISACETASCAPTITNQPITSKPTQEKHLLHKKVTRICLLSGKKYVAKDYHLPQLIYVFLEEWYKITIPIINTEMGYLL